MSSRLKVAPLPPFFTMGSAVHPPLYARERIKRGGEEEGGGRRREEGKKERKKEG